MNEIEFERIARRAAADLRSQAARIADTEQALAQLMAGETQSHDATPSRLVSVDDNDRRRRSPWLPILIAAASAATIGGIVLIVRNDTPERIVSTTGPDGPSPSLVDTAPASTPQTEPEPATTVVPDTTVPAPFDAVVAVPDERRPQLVRTVLATYGVGDGPGQLGFESCQECEPVRPFAPVVTDDGTVFVADAYNDRWQVFRDSTWTSFPYRVGEVVTATPVVGPDGLIYASVADDLAGRSGLRIVSYDPHTWDVVATYPGGNPASGSVDLVNDAIEVAGRSVHTFDALLGVPRWNVDRQTSRVTLSLSGIQRQFRLPPGWWTNDTEVTPLDDGSIVLRVDGSDGAGPPDWLLVRLWPDGTWATGTIGTSPSTTNLDGRFSDTGYVQLEDAIVEYALPTKANGDESSAPIELGTVLVADVLQEYPAGEPEELYRAMIGSAIDQIGLEDCRECDPGRPWGPVVLPDGRIVIADGVNRRWITVTDGVPTATPLPDRIGFVSQPLVDADGRIVVAAQAASAATPGAVMFFDPDDLSAPVEEVPADVTVFSSVELDGTDVIVNDRPAARLPKSVGERPEAVYAFDRSPATVAVTWNGQRRVWQFPYDFARTGGVRLPDGSITLTAFDGTTDLLVRLMPDGTAASIAVQPPAAWNGGSFTGVDGLVQLELEGDDWVIRRYRLPGS